MHDDDVIAAIATGYAIAAIGIIRVSGFGAFSLLEKIFTKKPPFEHRRIYYGHIKESAGNVIDEVLVAVFHAPNSYTGEDSFEISCHGGIVVLNSVLERVLEAGARLAQPGEFTKRAFLNGKMDLSQAEAVEKVISSKSKRALFIAQRQLSGKFSGKIDKIREQILSLMADNEVIIDHPEEELGSYSLNQKVELLHNISQQLQDILKASECGDSIFKGMVLSIIGKPNVGKSSLLNVLIGSERSIVTDIPGTTRDVVSEGFTIKGIPCTILDTAGIRKTEDRIEYLGVERSRRAIDDADVILMVFDASRNLDNEDFEILDYAEKTQSRIIGVLNKIDMGNKCGSVPLDNVVRISCKTKEGIKELEEEINAYAVQNTNDADIVSLNAAQKESLKEGIIMCDKLIQDEQQNIDPALIGVDFMSLAASLDEILGKITDEDMLDVMFKKFCIGK